MERSKRLLRVNGIVAMALMFLMLFLCSFAYAEAASVTGITLNETEITINRKKSFTLKATVEPKDAKNKKVEWISTNPEVATVKNGTVKAVADGTCDIICKALDESGTQAVCHVTVLQMIQGVQVKEKKVTIPYAGIYQPQVTIKPADATNSKLKWESSNESICTVDENGQLYGNQPGDCEVTVSATDGSGKKAKILVHVNAFGIWCYDTTLYGEDNTRAHIFTPDGRVPDVKVPISRQLVVAEYYPNYSISAHNTKKRSGTLTFTVGKEAQKLEFQFADKPKEQQSGDYYYVVNVDDTATITFFSGETISEIPSEIDGHTVSALGKEAFREKMGRIIVVPETVKSIGQRCFMLCGAQTIILPSALEYIGDESFSICQNLKEITIPASVKYIGDGFLDACQSLKKVTVEEGNRYYYINNGGMIDRRGNVLILFPVPGETADLAILNEVNAIANYATAECKEKSVIIPENVKYIGGFQFSDKLNHIELKGVEVLGNEAFNDRKLSSVILPNTLEEIRFGAFNFNDALMEIEIPSSVKKIDSFAFGVDPVHGRRFIVTKGSYAEKFCIENSLEYELKE